MSKDPNKKKKKHINTYDDGELTVTLKRQPKVVWNILTRPAPVKSFPAQAAAQGLIGSLEMSESWTQINLSVAEALTKDTKVDIGYWDYGPSTRPPLMWGLALKKKGFRTRAAK